MVQNSSTVERRFSSWIGGSILASLVSSFERLPAKIISSVATSNRIVNDFVCVCPPHSSVCDDLYHACTFAWDKLCALFTPH